MVFAAVLGALAGVIGFLPLMGSFALAKRVTSTSNLSYLSACLLGLLGSLLILACAAILCIVVARDSVLPFVVAEAVALSVSAVVFGVFRLVRK